MYEIAKPRAEDRQRQFDGADRSLRDVVNAVGGYNLARHLLSRGVTTHRAAERALAEIGYKETMARQEYDSL